VIDDADTIAQSLRLLHVVRREQYRLSATLEITNDVPHLQARLWIQSSRGLVEEQYVGIANQRSGHSQALALASRQVLDACVSLVLQLHPAQHLIRVVPALVETPEQTHDFDHVEPIGEQSLLELRTHALPNDSLMPAPLHSEDLDRATIWDEDTLHQFHGRGLPRPVWPQEGKTFPFGNRQVEAIHRHHLTITLGEVTARYGKSRHDRCECASETDTFHGRCQWVAPDAGAGELPPMRFVVAATLFVVACTLLVFEVDPVPTWFYVFAWYPMLLAADAVLSRNSTKQTWLTSPTRVISIFGWSIVIWMLYEVVNFRIQNWYYVFLPDWRVERWLGVSVSFATVVPAIVIGEQILSRSRANDSSAQRAHPSHPGHLKASVALGLFLVALAVTFPKLFSPLVWGAGLLIADPLVYRRNPEASLLHDIERGRWERISRLALTGVTIGFLWESLNYWARAKWVYTVPHLETVKWFEMPPFGFVGFPVFALSAWSIYHALCALGWGVPVYGRFNLRQRQLRLVAPSALLFCALTLWGMDHWTVSSVTPRLDTVTAVAEVSSAYQRLTEHGIETPFQLAAYDVHDLVTRMALRTEDAQRLIETARLATARGIGTEHVVMLGRSGISNLCDLAHADAASLWLGIQEPSPSIRPTPAEVRVWVRAAQRRCPNG